MLLLFWQWDFPSNGWGNRARVFGNASILFNNVFKVTGIRIGISQKGNVFVSMPDYKTGKLDDTGKDIYQDIAYPVTRQFRQELYDEVVKEFHAAMGQETQQTEGE